MAGITGALMGFLEYARSISLQKDYTATRIRVDPKLLQPILTQDKAGFNITLPLPSLSKENTISFLGFEFPEDPVGKADVGRLFRACVFHLTTRTLMPIEDKTTIPTSKISLAEAFSKNLVIDACVNAYILKSHPDKLMDLAFANALAFAKMKPVERIFNPATRIMAALLSKTNIGLVKGSLLPEAEDSVNQLAREVSLLKEKILVSLHKEKIHISDVLSQTADKVTQTLESHGPILEAPSLPYTEQTGPSTVFSKSNMLSESEIERVFRKSSETLGTVIPSEKSMDSVWKKETKMEASQAFDSWFHQRAREEKILERIREHIALTKFKSAEFPEEDYTKYLRARALLRGGSRRLLDSLRVAADALDEDPRKEMGQLDLPEVIQKIASRSPRTDVFKQHEYLSRSYAWALLFDVSASMQIKGSLGRALAICVAEAAKELLMDPGSWVFFGFSDRLYILKDISEAYSHRVRARIGGVKFDGLTYMADAIKVAGEIIAKRFDDQRFLIVLSDGWPYGYPNMPSALSRSIKELEQKDVMVIGVGLESERMSEFFKTSCAAYSQKDLIKKFSKIYVGTSAAALE